MTVWIIGNWKMNGSLAMTGELASAITAKLPAECAERDVRVGVCPPYPYLAVAREALAGGPVVLGAQNCHPEPSGAFTGEVAPPMLAELGVGLCLVGHSERRHVLGESDEFVRAKLAPLLAAGLTPVLCVGETLEQRERGREEQVVAGQVENACEGLSAQEAARMVVAYEPVWAIGTGHTATPDQANAMHRVVRGLLTSLYAAPTANGMSILYGGSVNEKNAGELLAQPDIDGALVGGASLNPDTFLSIISQALA